MIQIYGLTQDTRTDITLNGCIGGEKKGTQVLGTLGEELFLLGSGVYVRIRATIAYDGYLYINNTQYTAHDSPVWFDGYIYNGVFGYAESETDVVITVCQEYGNLLKDNDLSDIHFFFPFSPTGETLEAATMDFKILNTAGLDITPSCEFFVYDGGGIIGTFYVDKIAEENAGNVVTVSAVDVVGLLGQYTFPGYIAYKHGISDAADEYSRAVQDLVEDIFAQVPESNAYPVVDPDVADKLVYGYIPSCSCKDALQYLCFGCGLFLGTYRVERPVILSADEYSVHDIPDEMVFGASTVTPNDDCKTAVRIRQTDYVGDTDSVVFCYDLRIRNEDTIYSLTIGSVGNDIIESSKQCVPFQLCAPGVEEDGTGDGLYTTTPGVSVISNNGVTAVINVGHLGDGGQSYKDDDGTRYRRVVLEGTAVKDLYDRTGTSAQYKLYGEGQTVDVSDDATTVTRDNADEVADRLFLHHSAEKKANISFVVSGSEKPGDFLQLPFDGSYGYTRGRIVSMDIDFIGNQTIADVTLMCD